MGKEKKIEYGTGAMGETVLNSVALYFMHYSFKTWVRQSGAGSTHVNRSVAEPCMCECADPFRLEGRQVRVVADGEVKCCRVARGHRQELSYVDEWIKLSVLDSKSVS